MPFVPGGVSPGRVAHFGVFAQQPTNYVITGVTTDMNGLRLANCTLTAFETVTKRAVAEGTSNADGDYSLSVQGAIGLTFFVVAYGNSGNVVGATVNTLVPVNA